MAFPSLGSLFSVGVPMLTGHLQGQMQGQELLRKRQLEDEARARQAQMDALQQQLLQTQIGRLQHPPKPWEAQGFGTQEEGLGYAEALQRIQNPQLTPWQDKGFSNEQDYLDYLSHEKAAGRDDRPPWEEAGFPDEASYINYLGRSSRAQYPERFDADGLLPFDPRDPKNHQKFLAAYLMRTQGGHANPMTGTWEPPAPAAERMREAEVAYQEMARLTDPEYNPADDVPAEEPVGWHAPMAPGVDPADLPPQRPTVGAPPAPPAPTALSAPPAGPAPQSRAERRVAELKAQGVSREEAFRILKSEGLLDVNGFLVEE